MITKNFLLISAVASLMFLPACLFQSQPIRQRPTPPTPCNKLAEGHCHLCRTKNKLRYLSPLHPDTPECTHMACATCIEYLNDGDYWKKKANYYETEAIHSFHAGLKAATPALPNHNSTTNITIAQREKE